MTLGAPAEALANASLALARALHGGATMWCWSPESDSHAHHLAVEFVHPVVVGKPALPALAVEPGDVAEQLRRTARPGDVLVVVAAGDHAGAADVAARAPAWALDVIWLATGPAPSTSTSARVVDLGTGADDADIVCAYHLLWELTHVCLEQPGVLTAPVDTGASCPACLDAGDLGEVERIGDPDATVVIGGMPQPVDLSLVGPCEVGELVVVHAGVAIARLAGAGNG